MSDRARTEQPFLAEFPRWNDGSVKDTGQWQQYVDDFVIPQQGCFFAHLNASVRVPPESEGNSMPPLIDDDSDDDVHPKLNLNDHLADRRRQDK